MGVATERFPSNPAVLAHAGEYFHCIRDFETAEKLYVGALLVNPHHDGALLGFAHFFADAAAQLNSWVRVADVKNSEIQSMWQTHLSSAETFLKKIDSKSPYYLMAKVEIIWLQEIRCVYVIEMFACICMYVCMYVCQYFMCICWYLVVDIYRYACMCRYICKQTNSFI